MISYKNISNNYFLIGLSSDEKPIDGITNGTAYLEMDTGTVYVLDAENARWLELGGDTPTPPEPPVPEEMYTHKINWTGYFISSESGNTIEDISGEQTGVLTMVCPSNYQPQTLADLFDFVNDNDYQLVQIEPYENLEDNYHGITHNIANPIVLFDNASKLLLHNIYGADQTDPDNPSWESRALVITSFVDNIE